LAKAPVSTTTPWVVVTLILKPLLMLFASSSDLTFVVIQLSDTARFVSSTALLLVGVFMSPSTLLTPSTPLASFAAKALASLVAEPVSVTTPLVVDTLMSDCLRLSSPIRLAFTLVVMAVAVMAAPTLLLCGCGTVSVEAASAVPRLSPATRPAAITALRNGTLVKVGMFMLRLHFIVCASCFRERISSMAIGFVTDVTEEIVFIMASGDRSVWVTHAAVSVSGLGMSWKNWVLRDSLGTVLDSATHSVLARAGLVSSVSHIATR